MEYMEYEQGKAIEEVLRDILKELRAIHDLIDTVEDRVHTLEQRSEPS